MDQLETVSLTKGCFVHKPDKPKKSKACQSSLKFPMEEHKRNLWNEVEGKIMQIEKRSYMETFDGIVKFVQNCFQFPLQQMEEVPAAVLFMGVNMSDHSSIFRRLEKHLHSNEIPTTVILESRKCANVTNMLQLIHQEILEKFKEFLDSDESLPKRHECSFAKLQEHLEKIKMKAIPQSPMKAVSSPRKKLKQALNSKMQSMTKAMVLLIQDVESFSSDVLQELVLLCKIYSGKLPIVLIFGMASAMVTLHSILPQKALCCLGVETFYSVSATEFLTRIIEEVIISPDMPFKFGPKVFRLIVDTVLYHDFSISNLTYLLKFAMIEHLYGRNFTSLCCHETEIEATVNSLNNKELQVFKELPSIQKYLENNPLYSSCMKDSTAFKESIISFAQKLFNDQRHTLILLQLLHCFVKDLPGCPLGKQLRELYSLSLGKEICLTDAYLDAQKLLMLQSQQSLLSKLEASLQLLENIENETNLVKSIKTSLADSIEKLSKLNSGDFEKNVQDPLMLQTEKITSRFQLQEKIHMSIKLKRSNFEAVRNEIIDDLLQIFKRICPPSQRPLYEVFYFDNISSIKRHLMAVPRVTSCHSLANPQHYLKCNCCKITLADEMQANMPDISILYKLHLESGKLINLCDWLEAFKAIKQNENTTSKKRNTKVKANADEFNIRFLLAVSELQMLGFIKSTKRKTDHVARLTFGSF
ncbi:hypothetical protein JTE90_029324 [Oedothorax gibbosus]|uniref:Origin recognition complex subunit 3 n=1 Tax=Oedothorax gibbosus TaxID=931172 RepID=A0AAV6UH93_9ARAC|nr:hypothetical protein JTE90_029324 [Oedothorax gibbosus]